MVRPTAWWPRNPVINTPSGRNYEEVTVTGSTIKVELNGTVILDADLSKVTEFMGGNQHPRKDPPAAASVLPATTVR
jgi:hypothetical protein